MCRQSKRFIGKGCQESSRVKELGRTALPHGCSLGFMVMELISGLSLSSHSDSDPFLVVHTSFRQDECQ